MKKEVYVNLLDFIADLKEMIKIRLYWDDEALKAFEEILRKNSDEKELNINTSSVNIYSKLIFYFKDKTKREIKNQIKQTAISLIPSVKYSFLDEILTEKIRKQLTDDENKRFLFLEADLKRDMLFNELKAGYFGVFVDDEVEDKPLQEKIYKMLDKLLQEYK